MRYSLFAVISLVIPGLALSLALTNPAMLPDHPGHPMSELKDPISGMPLANDAGRSLWTDSAALEKGAVSYDASSIQTLPGYQSLEFQGAGVLPKTKGYPEIKIEPPVKEATKLKK